MTMLAFWLSLGVVACCVVRIVRLRDELIAEREHNGRLMRALGSANCRANYWERLATSAHPLGERTRWMNDAEIAEMIR